MPSRSMVTRDRYRVPTHITLFRNLGREFPQEPNQRTTGSPNTRRVTLRHGSSRARVEEYGASRAGGGSLVSEIQVNTDCAYGNPRPVLELVLVKKQLSSSWRNEAPSERASGASIGALLKRGLVLLLHRQLHASLPNHHAD